MSAYWRECSMDDKGDFANALSGIGDRTGDLLTDMYRPPEDEGEPESPEGAM